MSPMLTLLHALLALIILIAREIYGYVHRLQYIRKHPPRLVATYYMLLAATYKLRQQGTPYDTSEATAVLPAELFSLSNTAIAEHYYSYSYTHV